MPLNDKPFPPPGGRGKSVPDIGARNGAVVIKLGKSLQSDGVSVGSTAKALGLLDGESGHGSARCAVPSRRLSAFPLRPSRLAIRRRLPRT